MIDEFRKRGWVRFPYDPALADWVRAALPAARASIDDPAHAHWHDCEGTWFIGVDALNNDVQGHVGGVPLSGQAVNFIRSHLGWHRLHRAQVSVIWPGYPRPRRGEDDAAFRYRARRDAAHVDGLKPDADRRRRVEEPHAWILGIPLNQTSADDAPLVLWEGSHIPLRAAFCDALADHPADRQADIDVTETYQTARRAVFENCPRITLHAQPGEAYLLHRHLLHGVASWTGEARAEGRMIAYFRPDLPGGVARWLDGD